MGTTYHQVSVLTETSEVIGSISLYESERSEDLYISDFNRSQNTSEPAGLMREALAVTLNHMSARTIALDAYNLRGGEGDYDRLAAYYIRLGFRRDPFGNCNSFYGVRTEIIQTIGSLRFVFEWTATPIEFY